MMEKRDSRSSKIFHNRLQNCPHFRELSYLGGGNKWMTSYVYVKKWIIVVILKKLISIYFTWLVRTVNHKYNVLLKRNDACLMPHNTFVCVSHVHSPWRFHLPGNTSTMLCWRCFFPLPSPFIGTLARSLATLSCSHTIIRQSQELTRARLASQRLDSIIKYFCNSLTFRWRERNQNCP